MTIAFIGGRPGMISAATAAVAVLVTPLVRDHGVQYSIEHELLLISSPIIPKILEVDLRRRR